SAEFILKDPTVEFAVLERARGGILRAGVGFTTCDIGIITNINEDDLGLSDIDTLDDVTRVKSVVVDTVKPEGLAVLNAEDPYCMKIAKTLQCNVAYFALDEEHPMAKKLSKEGKIVAVYENGFVTIKKGDWKIRIERVINIPITVQGAAKFMIQNVLAAALAGYLYGFKTQDISLSLQTFMPSPSQTPGRLNIFDFTNFKIMIDFAHNPAGYLAIEDFLKN